MKLVSLLFALVACGGAPENASPEADDGEPKLTHVRLALNWFAEPEFGGFYQGVADGSYQRAGFDVEILPGGPGAPTLELLTSGQAEAAITSADDLLLKRAHGVTAIGVWPAFQLSPVGLMARADVGVSRFEDISKGTVALEIGGPFQSLLWKRFGYEGKVQMVPTTGSISTFLADPALIQQAYITSEPCAVKEKGVDTVFLKAADAGWNPYGTLVAMPDPPPAWAGAFLKATAAAWTAYIADPTATNAVIAAANDQMTPSMLACVTEAQRPFLTGTDGLGAMTQSRWSELSASLVALGLLPEGSTDAGAWKNIP